LTCGYRPTLTRTLILDHREYGAVDAKGEVLRHALEGFEKKTQKTPDRLTSSLRRGEARRLAIERLRTLSY